MAMDHKYRLVNGCQEWTGKTLKAAVAARDATLNKLFHNFESDIPTLIYASDRWMGLVFQRHDGDFSYRLIERTERGGLDAVVRETAIIETRSTRREVEFRCRRHLAQQLFETWEGYAFEKGFGVLHPDDVEGLKDHTSWVAWQETYARIKFKNPGLTDQQIRAAVAAETGVGA